MTSTDWGTANISLPPQQRDKTSFSSNFAEDVDIAIIGAGPAGLAACIGLIQSLPESSEQKIRIYERAKELRTSSQGMISLWGNGMSYLAKLHPELPKRVTNLGSPLKGSINIKIRDKSDITTTSRTWESGSVLIRWHALQTALAEMVPEEMIQMDHSLVTYEETEESVSLQFDNGTCVRSKIVIGADGTFSSVRRVMYADDTDRPIYFGQMNWNALIETSELPENSRPPGNSVTAISYDGEDTPRWSAYVNDCGGGYTFFQLRITDRTKSLALSGSNGRGGLGLPGVKAALLPLVHVSSELSNVLEALPERSIFERSIVGRLPLSSWRSAGHRVALLGDAAHGQHPLMGQGANSALGSAVALVEGILASYQREQDRNGPSHWLVEGLAIYETKRRPRMDWIQRAANMMGCSQNSESVSTLLDKDTQMAWFKWPQSDDDTPPPSEGQDVVRSFDPLSEPGVTLL